MKIWKAVDWTKMPITIATTTPIRAAKSHPPIRLKSRLVVRA